MVLQTQKLIAIMNFLDNGQNSSLLNWAQTNYKFERLKIVPDMKNKYMRWHIKQAIFQIEANKWLNTEKDIGSICVVQK